MMLYIIIINNSHITAYIGPQVNPYHIIDKQQNIEWDGMNEWLLHTLGSDHGPL